MFWKLSEQFERLPDDHREEPLKELAKLIDVRPPYAKRPAFEHILWKIDQLPITCSVWPLAVLTTQISKLSQDDRQWAFGAPSSNGPKSIAPTIVAQCSCR
jgi:hypothetical protein